MATAAEKILLKKALGNLNSVYENRICNDLSIPNTDEMKSLWHEAQIYNIRNKNLKPSQVSLDPDYISFPISNNSTVIVDDSLLIFLLQKHLGLL